MNISKSLDGSTLSVSLEGRLDTNTSPLLENELKSSLDNVIQLVLDLAELTYISSAGLRVLLSAQKIMNAQSGSMLIRNATASVMEIFEMTGFTDILTIE